MKFAIVMLAACGGSSDPAPAPAGSAAPPAGIQLPVETGARTPVYGYVAFTVAADGVHVLGPIAAGDVLAGQALEVATSGQLVRALPGGTPTTRLPDHFEPSTDHSIVFAARDASITVLDRMHAMGARCTNLAVAVGTQVSALPVCAPQATAGGVDQPVQLVVEPSATETAVMTSQPMSMKTAKTPAELAAILVERKASSELAARTDARLRVRPDLTIGTLADTIAALRNAGFTDITIDVPPPTPIPVPPGDAGSAGSGVGRTNPPPPSLVVHVDCTRVDGAALEIGQRVMRSRIGVFRACFQKEIPRGAHDGAADVSFGVKDGKPTTVTIAGNVPSDAVGDCTRTSILRMTFPKEVSAVRCAITYKK